MSKYNVRNRYQRAMAWLETAMENDPAMMKCAVETNNANLMVLRNSVNLWEDYEENPDYILGDVNHDPNHPDNLSAIVWDDFRSKYRHFNFPERLKFN